MRYEAKASNRIEISYKPIHKRAVDIREYPIRPAQHLDLSNNQNFLSNGTIPVSLVPEAKIAVGHGQMHERDLEQVMVQFMQPFESCG